MSSAAEAETGALYINARKAVEEQNILEELGHKQPPTPIQTDNSTAEGIVNNRVQPKRTKSMDMRFHWLQDCVNQKQFRFYWHPGTTNRGDHFTKHHPASHHRNMRPELLTPHKVLMALRKLHNMRGGARSLHYCKGVLDRLYMIIGYYVPSSEMRQDFYLLYFYFKVL